MPVTTQQIISALADSGKWNGSQITFSIPGAGAVWSGYGANDEPGDADYAIVSPAQAAAFRLAIAAWDSVIAPSFVEVSDTAPGAIRVAFTDVQDHGASSTNTAAYAYLPTATATQSAKSGDVWLDETLKSASFDVGQSAYETLLHELGHSLGLKHPFEDGATLPTEFANTRYTVMAYDEFTDSVLKVARLTSGGIEWSGSNVNATTPMLFDLIAIQSKYGLDPLTASGDTTYTWNQANPILETVYDTGGVDTWDLSAQTRESIVDLTPGAFSSIAHWSGGAQAAYWATTLNAQWALSFLQGAFADSDTYTWSNNVAIAQGTVIENVIGGSGSDTIGGNAAANSLYGRLGDDSISGGDGQDYLRGDEGNDSLVGGAAFDDLNGNMGDDSASGGDGDDWVVGGKDNDRLNGDAGLDIVYGNLGNDTLDGGADADVVRGGQGDDLVNGGAGDDWLAGDRGNDTITGGLGADIFHTHGDAGIDRVTDFSLAQGDRVNLLPGTIYTLSQVGADTAINMTGGGQMILVGVSVSSLTGAWIFGA